MPPFTPTRRFRALLYGVLLVTLGFFSYTILVLLTPLRHLVAIERTTVWLQNGIWYTGVPVFFGIALCWLDLFVLLPRRPRRIALHSDQTPDNMVTVVLTAYNDMSSIGLAVADFKNHPLVRRVIVIDNNSIDQTSERAREAGAEVFVEKQPGYGRCVFRALTEGMNCIDSQLTLLCEGDMTFRAGDIDKFLAYARHAEIVNGTRIVEQLREPGTQLTTFMYYGNFFTGKLLEAKHLGMGTFTDVGTTYKLCRNTTLRKLLPVLDPSINLEFNAHLLDTALCCGVPIVECPVTFHPRVGVSKGGNTHDFRALQVGIRMMLGIVVSWRFLSRQPGQ